MRLYGKGIEKKISEKGQGRVNESTENRATIIRTVGRETRRQTKNVIFEGWVSWRNLFQRMKYPKRKWAKRKLL